MRIVLQRVAHASVTVDEKVIGKIQRGFLLLVGVTHDDAMEDMEYLVRKIVQMRIFEDEEGKLNRSIQDIGGEILSVSQFTLYAETKKGNRPSFSKAAPGDVALEMFEQFNGLLRETGIPVETGQFGADMKVELLNDGPVTILLDSKTRQWGVIEKENWKEILVVVAMDGSRLAKMRVSYLKIEPKVSIFPVIEANVASITCATMGNLSSSLFLYFLSVTHVSCSEDYILRKIKTGKSLVNRGVFPVFYFYTFIGVGFLGLCGLLRRRSWRFG